MARRKKKASRGWAFKLVLLLAVAGAAAATWKWNEDRNLPKWENQLLATDEKAIELQFSGTPSFALENPDGSLEPIQGGTLDDLKKAIKQAQ